MTFTVSIAIRIVKNAPMREEIIQLCRDGGISRGQAISHLTGGECPPVSAEDARHILFSDNTAANEAFSLLSKGSFTPLTRRR